MMRLRRLETPMKDQKPLGSDFPGHQDAGKFQDWLTQKVSETTLAKDLLSKIQAATDEQTDP